MPDNLLNLIKKAAIDAVNSDNPVSVLFGRLASTEPITVMIDQKLLIDSSFLVITRRIADMIEREELKAGGKLLLLRMQGGQKFVVVDGVV